MNNPLANSQEELIEKYPLTDKAKAFHKYLVEKNLVEAQAGEPPSSIIIALNFKFQLCIDLNNVGTEEYLKQYTEQFKAWAAAELLKTIYPIFNAYEEFSKLNDCNN